MDVPACQGCATLNLVVEQLQAEVTRLRSELAAAKKNSSNSSKPPSSDNGKPNKKPKSDSKRKRGGQPGHPQHERTPFADDQVDYTDLHCFECPDGHGPVVPSKLPPKVVQQAELPS
jgi:transposase